MGAGDGPRIPRTRGPPVRSRATGPGKSVIERMAHCAASDSATGPIGYLPRSGPVPAGPRLAPGSKAAAARSANSTRNSSTANFGPAQPTRARCAWNPVPPTTHPALPFRRPVPPSHRGPPRRPAPPGAPPPRRPARRPPPPPQPAAPPPRPLFNPGQARRRRWRLGPAGPAGGGGLRVGQCRGRGSDQLGFIALPDVSGPDGDSEARVSGSRPCYGGAAAPPCRMGDRASQRPAGGASESCT